MQTQEAFEIKYAFIAYIPPYDESNPLVLKTEILKKEDNTTEYLFKIFDKAIDLGKVEITFKSDDSKKQNNEVRNHILAIVQKDRPRDKTIYAKKLAELLYKVTDERNGTGLLSIILGIKAGQTRIVLMRFKGDDGLVNSGKKNLSLDYISEIFTRKTNHYKLVAYNEVFSTTAFWKGYTVDKQLSSSKYNPVSKFWVEEFLQSTAAINSSQGTLQLSKIIKELLSKTSDIDEQEEIISGVINFKNKRTPMSLADFCDNYLSPELKEKVRAQVNSDIFFNSPFTIDRKIYNKQLGKTVVSLQNGITAYVPTFAYEQHVTEIENNDGSKNILIEGRLAGKRIQDQSQGSQRNVQKKKIGNG